MQDDNDGCIRIDEVNEPHLACLFLIDTSDSMKNYLDTINRELNIFKNELCKNEVTKRRLDIAVIGFSDWTNIVQDFTPIKEMGPISLTCDGIANVGEAIINGIKLVKDRDIFYNNLGVPCYKPWIFLITNGNTIDDSNEELKKAKEKIIEEESKGDYGKLKFFAVSISDSNSDNLRKITNRVIVLPDLRIRRLFDWLGESMVTISVSTENTNENPILRPYVPPPDYYDDW